MNRGNTGPENKHRQCKQELSAGFGEKVYRYPAYFSRILLALGNIQA